jgi:hypothetical protein
MAPRTLPRLRESIVGELEAAVLALRRKDVDVMTGSARAADRVTQIVLDVRSLQPEVARDR